MNEPQTPSTKLVFPPEMNEQQCRRMRRLEQLFEQEAPAKGTVFSPESDADLCDSAPKSPRSLLDAHQKRLLSGHADALHDERLAKALLVSKCSLITKVINQRLGKRLLAKSKKQAALNGKTWFMCNIMLPDWMRMWQSRVSLHCLLNVWERGKRTDSDDLQKLLAMDGNKEYMLDLNVVNPFGAIAEFSLNVVLNPNNAAKQPISCPWQFTCTLMNEHKDWARLKQLTKWQCNACGRIIAQEKLKTCATCRQRRYCDRDCQAHDWVLHKDNCKLLCELRKPIE